MTKIGVVMTTWNGLAFTKPALASVKSSHDLSIIVVDDRSTDGTREWLTEHRIRWLDGGAKPGLSAKWNMGIEALWKEGADYVSVWNNDVLFSPVTIDGMLKAFKPGILVVCAENFKGVLSKPEDILGYTVQKDQESKNGGFSGFMISPECWSRVGSFDEGFTQYDFEDFDYLHRTHLAGGRAISTLLAPYWHYEGGSKAQDPNFMKRSHEVNREYFRKKWGWLVGIEPKPSHLP